MYKGEKTHPKQTSLGTFKPQIFEGHKPGTIVQLKVLESTQCFLWWSSFGLASVLIMLQEVHVWLALRIKVSRQQTTCPHCGHSLWSLSVLSCWFLQILLLFGYSWRNRHNLDSHCKTNNRKNKHDGKTTAVWKYFARVSETSELM